MVILAKSCMGVQLYLEELVHLEGTRPLQQVGGTSPVMLYEAGNLLALCSEI